MTAGRGVAHSEFSLDDTALSQGLQLWVALPAAAAEVAPGFEQHSDLPYFDAPGGRVTVLLGTLGGVTSPATTYTPILGAQLDLAAGSAATIAVRPDFEHAVLAITGDLDVAGSPLTPGPLLYLGTGRTELTISTETGARALLIGGEPFPDDLVMWWNFVGRDHDDIATARAAWEAQDPTRFPVIPGHTPTERIPAPTLPNVRLRPRNRGR
jgi:redox-sensitive bicupin YhaK (pirin superfamily)